MNIIILIYIKIIEGKVIVKKDMMKIIQDKFGIINIFLLINKNLIILLLLLFYNYNY
jgi:hypothetical protein